jgi:hypothetical protein
MHLAIEHFSEWNVTNAPREMWLKKLKVVE